MNIRDFDWPLYSELKRKRFDYRFFIGNYYLEFSPNYHGLKETTCNVSIMKKFVKPTYDSFDENTYDDFKNKIIKLINEENEMKTNTTATESRFKIGDRVKIVTNNRFGGKTGIIVKYDNSHCPPNLFMVQYDSEIASHRGQFFDHELIFTE